MVSCGRFAGFVIAVIVLTAVILLCLSFLAIGVGVAVVGNDDYNNCKGNVSFCEQVLEQSKYASYALMAAASVVTILLVPALATAVAYFVIEMASGRAGKCEVRSEEQTDQNEDLDFHDYKATKLDRKKFQQLSVGPGVMLYFTFVFFTLSLIGALWMLVIAYDNSSQKTAKLWPFIITELIMGLACPILACIGFALLTIVGTYTMAEQVDFRIIINHMIPSVMLKKDNSERHYWVIVQHYHIKLKESWGEAGQFIHAIDRNICSTWILAIVSSLAVVLYVSSFINRSFVQTLTVPVTEFLEESDICLTYSCFTPITFDHLNVNCSEVNLVDLGNIDIVHCFKFIPLSSEIIANLSISVGFYLATVHFLKVIFVAATVLHVGKSHIVWGILFILAGCLTLAGAMVYIFLSHFANIRLDVILAGQIFLVAIYLVLIGILLCTGDVLVIENIKPPAAGSITDGEEMMSIV